MAGFLDSQERIIDMVLTGRGKELLLRGDLVFKYWVPFDDEVDYDPFIAGSGSMLPDELRTAQLKKIEDPLVLEAHSGYRSLNAAAEDRTNVNRPLYTVPATQKNLPSMDLDDEQIRLQSFQQVTADGVCRASSSVGTVDPRYATGSYPAGFPLEGFLVTVYKSGSDGFTEIPFNIDSQGNIVYRNDLTVKKEVP